MQLWFLEIVSVTKIKNQLHASSPSFSETTFENWILVSSVLEIGLVSSWNWSRQFLILILSSRLKQNFEGDLNWVRLSLTFFGPFPSIYFVHNQYFYWKFVKKPGFLFHILLGTMVLFFKFVEGARRNWRFQRLTGN